MTKVDGAVDYADPLSGSRTDQVRYFAKKRADMGLERDCTHAMTTMYTENRIDKEKPFELTMKELDEEVRFVCWTFYRYSVLCSELRNCRSS